MLSSLEWLARLKALALPRRPAPNLPRSPLLMAAKVIDRSLLDPLEAEFTELDFRFGLVHARSEDGDVVLYVVKADPFTGPLCETPEEAVSAMRRMLQSQKIWS